MAFLIRCPVQRPDSSPPLPACHFGQYAVSPTARHPAFR